MTLASLLLAALLSPAADKTPPRAPDRTGNETARVVRALEPEIRRIMRGRKVPGLGLVVVQNDRIVVLDGLGYRDLEKHLPFTPDTVCHIASTSKAFCGLTLCLASSDGLLDLDESPKRLLPDFRMRDPEADRGMTLTDLMSHSSGLPRTDLGWSAGKIDAKEATRLLSEGEPTYPFRYVGQYSNMMVETAGRAVAAAYGMPWPELLRKKITDPLGMASTRPYAVPSDLPDRAAVGYYTDPDGQPKPEVMTRYNAIAAAGGLQSTARDLGQWLRLHLGGGIVDGRRIVPEAVLAKDHEAHFDYGGRVLYGFGWFHSAVRPDPILSHGGDLPGFQTDVVLVPGRRLGFAILANNDSAGSRGPIESLLLDRLVGKPDLREIQKTAKAAGLYWTVEGAHRMRVNTVRTELQASVDDRRMMRMRRTGEATWTTFDPHDPEVTLTVSDDPKKRGKKTIVLARDGKATAYFVRPTAYHADTTPAALVRKVAEATGLSAARQGKVLECRYTARYAGDAVDAVGLLYRAPAGRVAAIEGQWVGPLRNTYAQYALAPGLTESADETFRYDAAPTDPRLVSMAGYCNESAGLPKDTTVEIMGEAELHGEQAYLVKTTWPNGTYRLDTISKGRNLPLRREVPNVETDIYEDYRVVDGIAVPMRLTTMDANFTLTRITVTAARALNHDPHWAWHPTAWSKISSPPSAK